LVAQRSLSLPGSIAQGIFRPAAPTCDFGHRQSPAATYKGFGSPQGDQRQIKVRGYCVIVNLLSAVFAPIAPKDLLPKSEGDLRSIVGPRLQHFSVGRSCIIGKLHQKTGLPHPCFPANHNDSAGSRFCLFQSGAEPEQFGLSSDEIGAARS
jgi:hypothetical protein